MEIRGSNNKRLTAKLVAIDPDLNIPFCVGRSTGRLNLPGGGIDEGETDLDALAREIREETYLPLEKTHLSLARLADLQYLGEFRGITRHSQLSVWRTYMGRLAIPASDIHPVHSEVADIAIAPYKAIHDYFLGINSERYEQFLANRSMSRLAEMALSEFVVSGYAERLTQAPVPIYA